MEYNRNKLKISYFGASDKGRVRESNQDAWYVSENQDVIAIADGMGGLPYGDIASQLCIECVKTLTEKRNRIHHLSIFELFHFINQNGYRHGQKLSPQEGIGSTLTLGMIQSDQMTIGHIGDSGIYLCRNQKCFKLTQDHTLAEKALRKAKNSEFFYIPESYYSTLTQCIGQQEKIHPEIYQIEIEVGDKFLFYTDGLTEAFNELEIATRMQIEMHPKTLVKSLIKEANQRGGLDNITLIVLLVRD